MINAGGIRLYMANELWFVETTITEAFETSSEASTRVRELIEVFGLCQDEVIGDA
jgi:hypothetical protein